MPENELDLVRELRGAPIAELPDVRIGDLPDIALADLAPAEAPENEEDVS